MKFRFVILGSLLLIAPAAVPAHTLHHAIGRADAVVVTIRHADGSPFADQPYRLFTPGGSSTFQRGQTDAAGRVSFLPDRAGEWRLTAAAPDGHGVDVTILVEPPASPRPADSAGAEQRSVLVAAPPPATTSSLWERVRLLVAGVALLAGIFGVLALALRKRG